MKKYDPYFEDPFYEDKIREKEYNRRMGRLEAERDFKEGKSMSLRNRHKLEYLYGGNSFIKAWIPFIVGICGLLFRNIWLFAIAIIWAIIFNWND